MKKRYLFLQTKPPLEGGPEAFDLALTAAAFDHEVHLVLADDGVFWLRAGLPEVVIEAVEDIVWERESLKERGLSAPDEITRAELAALIAETDVVVTG
jgi:sulfur relay (sulfurtransferase) DsrF/TusC family protein